MYEFVGSEGPLRDLTNCEKGAAGVSYPLAIATGSCLETHTVGSPSSVLEGRSSRGSVRHGGDPDLIGHASS